MQLPELLDDLVALVRTVIQTELVKDQYPL